MTRTIGIPLDDTARRTAVDHLQPFLVDLVALGLDGKQLHWHVTGPEFRPVHQQLDEVVDVTRTASDDVAERAVTLGIPVDGRPATVGKESRLPELPEGWIDARDAVQLYVTALEGVIERARASVPALEVEPVTQDLVITVLHELEKQLWMLQAQLR
jgi:starvation-inducible DNA-binding protein